MRSPLILATLAAALFTTGCTSINTWGTAVPMGPTRYPAVPTEHVMILQSPPARAYLEIGYVSAIGGVFANEGEMYQKMQMKAAGLGADAIILQPAAGAATKPADNATHTQSVVVTNAALYPRNTALAIKYSP